MSFDPQCYYKSFDGSGSIYIGGEQNTRAKDLLNKYSIKVAIVLTPFRSEKQDYCQSLYLSTKDRSPKTLYQNFHRSYQFIDRHRKKTNILICSSQDRNICIVFLIAFLMRKYQYELNYVSRLFEHLIKNIQIPEDYFQVLKLIEEEVRKQKEEEEQKLRGSSIGRRIIRVRRDYGNISKESRFRSLSKNTGGWSNPEYFSKKGVDEPSGKTHVRRRSQYERNLFSENY